MSFQPEHEYENTTTAAKRLGTTSAHLSNLVRAGFVPGACKVYGFPGFVGGRLHGAWLIPQKWTLTPDIEVAWLAFLDQQRKDKA